jgi:uncharacterized protein YkwD
MSRPTRRPVRALTAVFTVLLGCLLAVTMAGAPASAKAKTQQQIIDEVFNNLNGARRANKAPLFTRDARLTAAAKAHTRLMAKYGKAALQLPGEPALVPQLKNQGFTARFAAVTVGVAVGYSGVQQLQRKLYKTASTRARLLDTRNRAVGVDLYFDHAKHKIWLAEYFGTEASAEPAARAAQSGAADHSAVERDIAAKLLNSLNSQRARNGLPALRMNAALVRSARAHNLAMAQHNEMSHQLPGEPYFTDRISRAGYQWYYAGENVGWNSDRSADGAYELQRMMYNETPPNDGHRRNILDTHYVDVGIDIYFDDTNGKMWLTQDFGRTR